MDQTATPLAFVHGLTQHGIKLGLDNIRTVCEALDHPERAFESIVVAGTNGKGSVAAMVERGLRADGVRTGRFTSPHLVDLTERFAIDGHTVDPSALVREAARLEVTIRRLLDTGRLPSPPTFFEATTALALLLFRAARVEMAILEVGMGGRFDATNVVDAATAVITTIDLDHQQYLGSTLPEIAFEKAGVVKPGAVVVTGEPKPAALEVIRRVCAERQATLHEAHTDVERQVTVRDGRSVLTLRTPVRRYGPITLALRGQHQVGNAVVSVRVLEAIRSRPISPEAIETGLSEVRWPGRLERLAVGPGRTVLLDAAHNVAAATALNLYLKDAFPDGLPVVFGAMTDKDAAGMLAALRPSIRHLVCTSADAERAETAARLAALAARACPDIPVTAEPSPAAALEIAWVHGPVVCATGSIHLVGELHRLADPPPCDVGVLDSTPG